MTSLGEGDLLNMQLSPDGKWIVFGAENGVLVLDSTTLDKVLFLPTEINANFVSFQNGGTMISAWDGKYWGGSSTQFYKWTFPQGKQVTHVKPTFINIDENKTTDGWESFPDNNYEFAFGWAYDWTFAGDHYDKTFKDSVAGLYSLSDGSIQYLVNYKLNSLAISPDKKLVVFGSNENMLVFMQYRDGKILAEIPEKRVKSLFFFPDGKKLAVVFSDQIKIYDTATFQMIASIKSSGINEISFSPDQSIMLLWGPWDSNDSNERGRTAQVFRVEDQKNIGIVYGILATFRSDSQGFFVYLPFTKFRVVYYGISPDKTKIERSNSFPGSPFRDTIYESIYSSPGGAFSSDNSKFLSFNVDEVWTNQKIRIFDISSTSVIKTFDLYPDYNYSIHAAIWLPSFQTFGVLGKSLAHCTSFALLDFKTNTIINKLGNCSDNDYPTALKPSTLHFSTDGTLLTAGRADQLLTWNLETSNYWQSDESFPTVDTSNFNSPDGTYQVTYFDDGKNQGILVSDIKNQKEILTINGYFVNFAFSSDSRLIAVSEVDYYGSKVTIYDLSSGKVLYSSSLWLRRYYAPPLAFSPDDRYLAILPGSGLVTLWGIPQ
ncbi:MAG: WD40 repeat domain-containing protein [Anaerolineaceae bacterium]